MNIEMVYVDETQVRTVTVYDISYDSCGFSLFLIYIDGQWMRKSDKYFNPVIK